MSGNYCVMPVPDSKVDETIQFIMGCMKEGSTNPVHFLNLNGYFIFSKSIIGFYIRTPAENYQAKAVKIMEKLQNDSSEGDDWKNED